MEGVKARRGDDAKKEKVMIESCAEVRRSVRTIVVAASNRIREAETAITVGAAAAYVRAAAEPWAERAGVGAGGAAGKVRDPRLWSRDARRFAGLSAVFPAPKEGSGGAHPPHFNPTHRELTHVHEQQFLALKDFLTPVNSSQLAAPTAEGEGVEETPSPLVVHQHNQDESVASVLDARESVHCALAPLLVVGQCFGLMPVAGVMAPTPQGLAFRLRSVRTLWSAVVAGTLVVVCGASTTHVVRALRDGPEGFMKGIGVATAGAVFYGCSAATVLLMLRLAPCWPPLMRRWAMVEKEQVPLIAWPPVRTRIRAAAATIFTLSYVEHLFSMLIHVPECLGRESDVASAPATSSRVSCDFLRLYVTRSHAFLFSTPRAVSYTPWLGVAIVLASELGTFAWNFLDVFVIVLSSALAARLAATNKRLLDCDLQVLTTTDWGRFRHAYAATSALVKSVDGDICSVVLLSFSSNLYFICLQLLNGLSPKSTSAVDYVYFFGSFAYLVGRTVALTLTAARIHDQSRVALPYLYQCPPQTYCLEAQRLQSHLVSDEMVLTGLRFFSITRSFLLAVAGAIVTYEVILLQFNMPPATAICNGTMVSSPSASVGTTTAASAG